MSQKNFSVTIADNAAHVSFLDAFGQLTTRVVRKLLADGDSNTKLAKNERFAERKIITRGLSLSPHKSAGVGNMCPNASDGCIETCLDHQGRAAVFRAIGEARKAKTLALLHARDWFVQKLDAELRSAERKAERENAELHARLNMFSDWRWEKTMQLSAYNAKFYDYTKNEERAGQLAENYWVTFSRAENNDAACERVLARGCNVAIVFADNVPQTYKGRRVLNGDLSDLRWYDERSSEGHWIGLYLKAFSNAERQKAIRSGFAVNAA